MKMVAKVAFALDPEDRQAFLLLTIKTKLKLIKENQLLLKFNCKQKIRISEKKSQNKVNTGAV